MDIDRKTASQLLSISIRTIDRYIRRGKLSARIGENGRIWLDRKEVMDLPRLEPFAKISKTTKIDNRHSYDNINFYRDLYEESKKALGDYHQKLEQANYRIGQLESQIIHRPAPKTTERDDDLISNEYIKRELAEREKELILLQEMLKKERLSRIVFAILTYILLAALPIIWYLLR
ncbi:hypothetical protein HZC21_01985 [Candidatus Peregrinibacteria bacterium]|nr:hypothetical protein [Candidatus Peregrinibacteria bacterium]